MRRRCKALLEYDGTAFSGWQKQKNAVSIQGLLEEKLRVVLRHPARVESASRTDAGVHAHGQVIAFDTVSDTPDSTIQRSLNGVLPLAIRVREVAAVPSQFDPRRDALWKEYRYTYWNHPAHPPFWQRYSWHVRHRLDAAAMSRAAALVVGEHDFSAFRASGCTAKSPLRRILSCEVVEKGERIQLCIRGQAFLYQMVRILAGTLYDIGSDKRPISDMAELLRKRDRKSAGKTAPAKGLILWEVAYGSIPRPGRMNAGLMNEGSA